MIKVKNTKTHQVVKLLPYNNHGHIVVVTDAELVLVECKPEEALLFRYKSTETIHMLPKKGMLVKGLVNYLIPILISRTENIEVGDWVYDNNQERIVRWGEFQSQVSNVRKTNDYYYKILALPEEFSPEQLQDIVDGKLKEGKYLLECEKRFSVHGDKNTNADRPNEYLTIKLNRHIIIHPVEERMYTLDEMLDNIVTFNLSTSYKSVQEAKDECPQLFATKRKAAKEWFENHVK